MKRLNFAFLQLTAIKAAQPEHLKEERTYFMQKGSSKTKRMLNLTDVFSLHLIDFMDIAKWLGPPDRLNRALNMPYEISEDYILILEIRYGCTL